MDIVSIIGWIMSGTIWSILFILWFLWLLYVAMMNIKRAVGDDVGSLPWQAKLLVYPTSVLFDIVEFIANVIVCTIIFLDWPREVTVSDRLRRYAVEPNKAGWRMLLVDFVRPMLDPFDPEGPHI